MNQFAEFLHLIGPSGILAIVLAAICLLYLIARNALKTEIKNKGFLDSILHKKELERDLHKYRFPLTMGGFVIALGSAIMAFNYPTYEKIIVDIPEKHVVIHEPMKMNVITKIELPKPPEELEKPKPEKPDPTAAIQEVKNYVDIDVQDFDPDEFVDDLNEIVDPTDGIVDVEDDFVLMPGEKAEPIGGLEAFYKYLNKNLVYPKKAKRLNLYGKVTLEFTIEKDGTITDIKVLKGIDPLLDDEAVRVVQNAPKWKPAKHRGRTVRTKMYLPIVFSMPK
jgi:protein TonB